MKRIYIAAVFIILGIIIFMNIDINNIGLKFLEFVKQVRGQNVELSEMKNSDSKTINHDSWTDLLTKYVTPEGFVDYEGFKKDKDELKTYLDLISDNPPKEDQSDEYKMAYWINAYNAFTIDLIVDNYPLQSIKKISDGAPMIDSPWDIKFFKIGGVEFDLNTIEHGILRKEYSEPRVHFAVNCASISCPKLLDEAFTPEKLDAQLEAQAHYFINNTAKNKISESKISISKIFNWFAVDFKSDGGASAFIQKYVDTDITKAEVSYLDYDWNLNKQQ